MDWTLALAIYGAALATITGAWAIYGELRRRRTRLHVTHGLFWAQDETGREEVIIIEVVNMSEHPVRWKGFSIQHEGEGEQWGIVQMPYYSGQIPTVIPPRDSAQVALLREPLERGNLDLSKPVRVKVWTADRYEMTTAFKLLEKRPG